MFYNLYINDLTVRAPVNTFMNSFCYGNDVDKE